MQHLCWWNATGKLFQTTRHQTDISQVHIKGGNSSMEAEIKFFISLRKLNKFNLHVMNKIRSLGKQSHLK